MLLSLIIPVYNVAPYVGTCLESIYDGVADEDSFEVIVVNDGSTDESASVVDGFAARHGNIQVITQENQGLSMARMNGLTQAKGDYVWFVDSDDWLKPGTVESITQLIRGNAGVKVFMTPIYRTHRSADDYRIDAPLLMEGEKVLLESGLPVYSATRYIILRSLFENPYLQFPKGLLHEDEYFGHILMMLADQVFVSEKSFYLYRFRPGSIMRSINIRSSYDYVTIYDLLKMFSETLPDSSKEAFLHHSQRFLSYSYRANEKNWKTPEFRRFKRKKGPHILAEFFRYRHLYSARELTSIFFLLIAPTAYRKRFPSTARQ